MHPAGAKGKIYGFYGYGYRFRLVQKGFELVEKLPDLVDAWSTSVFNTCKRDSIKGG